MAEDEREPGEAFCVNCPDHEACMTGWPCDKVKWAAEYAFFRKPVRGLPVVPPRAAVDADGS